MKTRLVGNPSSRRPPEPRARRRADRWVSGVAGGALLAVAARFGAWPTVALATMGGMLLGRGLSLAGKRRTAALDDATCGGVDCVEQAGKESFPASDPPSWSPTSVGAPDRQTQPS